VDAAGNLYVYAADTNEYDRSIWKRDTQGHWSVIATHGSAPGQVNPAPGAWWDEASHLALAVDAAGSLYVIDWPGPDTGWRIQKRDAQGN
jgi:hypothetical protein